MDTAANVDEQRLSISDCTDAHAHLDIFRISHNGLLTRSTSALVHITRKCVLTPRSTMPKPTCEHVKSDQGLVCVSIFCKVHNHSLI